MSKRPVAAGGWRVTVGKFRAPLSANVLRLVLGAHNRAPFRPLDAGWWESRTAGQRDVRYLKLAGAKVSSLGDDCFLIAKLRVSLTGVSFPHCGIIVMKSAEKFFGVLLVLNEEVLSW